MIIIPLLRLFLVWICRQLLLLLLLLLVVVMSMIVILCHQEEIFVGRTLLMITRNKHNNNNKNMVYTVAPLDQDAASFDFRVKTPHLFVALSTLLITSSRVLTTVPKMTLPLLLPNQKWQHAN